MHELWRRQAALAGSSDVQVECTNAQPCSRSSGDLGKHRRASHRDGLFGPRERELQQVWRPDRKSAAGSSTSASIFAAGTQAQARKDDEGWLHDAGAHGRDAAAHLMEIRTRPLDARPMSLADSAQTSTFQRLEERPGEPTRHKPRLTLDHMGRVTTASQPRRDRSSAPVNPQPPTKLGPLISPSIHPCEWQSQLRGFGEASRMVLHAWNEMLSSRQAELRAGGRNKFGVSRAETGTRGGDLPSMNAPRFSRIVEGKVEPAPALDCNRWPVPQKALSYYEQFQPVVDAAKICNASLEFPADIHECTSVCFDRVKRETTERRRKHGHRPDALTGCTCEGTYLACQCGWM